MAILMEIQPDSQPITEAQQSFWKFFVTNPNHSGLSKERATSLFNLKDRSMDTTELTATLELIEEIFDGAVASGNVREQVELYLLACRLMGIAPNEEIVRAHALAGQS